MTAPIPFEPRDGALREELARIRRDAERRYSEMDLLVAALNEHIADLRQERNHLLEDVARSRRDADTLRAELERMRSTWLVGRSKKNR